MSYLQYSDPVTALCLEAATPLIDALAAARKVSLNGFLERVYPVGAIYMSSEATLPSTLEAIGVWAPIQDKFLYAVDGAPGEEGGSAVSIVDFGEFYADIGFSDAHADKIYITRLNTTTTFAPVNAAGAEWGWATQTDAPNPTALIGSQTIGNIPPYYAVYMWQRVL